MFCLTTTIIYLGMLFNITYTLFISLACVVWCFTMFGDHAQCAESKKIERAVNLDTKLPYWDIWETQSAHLQTQYYTYYTYIWEHWHEMEERLLWIACVRATLLGL